MFNPVIRMVNIEWKRRDRDRMVVGLTSTVYFVSCISYYGEIYCMQHYVIKFVNDLWQVGGIPRIIWVALQIKLTAPI